MSTDTFWFYDTPDISKCSQGNKRNGIQVISLDVIDLISAYIEFVLHKEYM